MSRITATMAALKANGRTALIPYVTAGDPYADATPDIMQALADGPVIQKASERALARGIGATQVLDMVRAFRQRNNRTPVVLMGYANPV
ncbi:MAG: tryptophan synthase subunit alpha, partial [Rubrivivax sp.]|nr:tryptophan synthase subunit alpha [Rubrivivax sp.]